jgi:plasmid stabilization system protein ParE
MQIIRDEFYISKLDEIIEYIASSSGVMPAINFLDKLDAKIENLTNMPLKFRESNYYQDENVRDLIFKGYTIPFLIDREKEIIVILDIFKWSYRKVLK